MSTPRRHKRKTPRNSQVPLSDAQKIKQLLKQAQSLLRKSQYDKALPKLLALVELDKTSSSSYLLLGQCHAALKASKHATKAMAKAALLRQTEDCATVNAEAEHDFVSPAGQIARLQEEIRDLEVSLSELVASGKVSRPEDMRRPGVAEQPEEEECDEAGSQGLSVEHLQKAETVYNAGMKLLTLGKNAKALSKLEEAKKLCPQNVEYLFALARVHQNLGFWKPALQSMQDAWARRTELDDARDRRRKIQGAQLATLRDYASRLRALLVPPPVSLACYLPNIVLQRIAAVGMDKLPTSAERHIFHHASVLMVDVSGFTQLTEAFKQTLGRGGGARVTECLNEFFSKLLHVTSQHGGDCVKFAGDALIVLFAGDTSRLLPFGAGRTLSIPITQSRVTSSCIALDKAPPMEVPESQAGHKERMRAKARAAEAEEPGEGTLADLHALRATQCALELQESGEYEVEGLTLTIHVAVSAGTVYALHVGGQGDPEEWEFLLAGEPFAQLGATLDIAKAGDVVLSPEAWKLVSSHCEAELVSSYNPAHAGAEMRVTAVVDPVELISLQVPAAAVLADEANQKAMRAYLSRCILDKIDAGQDRFIGELRHATVVFVNVGLKLTQRISPTGNRTCSLRLLHAMARASIAIIQKNDGYRRQFLVDDKGPVLIAVFGVYPFAHEDDAYRAVKTAVQIRNWLLRAKIKHGIGIATGDVYAGTLGGEARREHTVVGDSVNTAARLSGKAYGKGVLAEACTFEDCKSLVNMEPEGQMKLKGKAEYVKTYKVLGLNHSYHEIVGKAGSAFPKDIPQGRAFSEALAKLRGQVLIVESVAGGGKTQFLRHCFHYAKASTKVGFVFYVRADSTEQHSFLSVWKRFFEQQIGLVHVPADPEEEVPVDKINWKQREQIRARTQKVLQFIGKKVLHTDNPLGREPLLPLLNPILNINFPANDTVTNILRERVGLKRKTFSLLASLVRHLLHGHKKVVLLLDNMHEADTESLRMIEKTVKEITNLKLVLVVAARPLNDWRRGMCLSPSQVFQMNPLTSDRIAELVKDRLELQPSCTLRPELLDFISQRGRGNPLFTIELVLHLQASGAIQVLHGDCQMVKENKETPESLRALLTRRVDSLNLEQSLVCKIASVFGGPFSRTHLIDIYNKNRALDEADKTRRRSRLSRRTSSLGSFSSLRGLAEANGDIEKVPQATSPTASPPIRENKPTRQLLRSRSWSNSQSRSCSTRSNSILTNMVFSSGADRLDTLIDSLVEIGLLQVVECDEDEEDEVDEGDEEVDSEVDRTAEEMRALEKFDDDEAFQFPDPPVKEPEAREVLYEFANSFLQSACYDLLPQAQVARLHLAIASLYGKAGESTIEGVTHHYSKAVTLAHSDVERVVHANKDLGVPLGKAQRFLINNSWSNHLSFTFQREEADRTNSVLPSFMSSIEGGDEPFDPNLNASTVVQPMVLRFEAQNNNVNAPAPPF